MRNLFTTIKLDPQGDKITCAAFGLFSSPAEIPRWDILCVTWRVLRISLRLNCAASNKKGTAWGRKWSSHWWRRTCTSGSSETFETPSDRTATEEKGTTSVAGSNCFSGTRGVKGTRASEQRRPRFWAKKAAGIVLRNIINKLSDERNLNYLHLKHYQMSTAQFTKRTTHLDIPGRIYDLYQHVVKTCPFCISIKPRPERSCERTLCRRCLRPHLSWRWISKDWRQNLWILDCIISCNSTSM